MRFLLAAAMLALFALPSYSEGRRRPCCDIRPEIPAPGAPQNLNRVADFPYIEFQKSWNSYIAGPEETDCEKTEGYHNLRENLYDALRRGAYRFGENCPLVKIHSDDPRYIQLRISCLNLTANRDFPLVFQLKADSVSRRFLDSLPEGRELTAVMELQNAELRRGKFYWQWTELRLDYVNPYLEALHRQFRDLAESDLLTPARISQTLGNLLPLAAAKAGGATRWRDYFSVVFKEGMMISFQSSCPLRYQSLTLQPDRRSLLEFKIGCTPNVPTIQLILMEDVARNLDALQLIRGDNFYADLRFRTIQEKEGQFYLDWDSISNIRTVRNESRR